MNSNSIEVQILNDVGDTILSVRLHSGNRDAGQKIAGAGNEALAKFHEAHGRFPKLEEFDYLSPCINAPDASEDFSAEFSANAAGSTLGGYTLVED